MCTLCSNSSDEFQFQAFRRFAHFLSKLHPDSISGRLKTGLARLGRVKKVGPCSSLIGTSDYGATSESKEKTHGTLIKSNLVLLSLNLIVRSKWIVLSALLSTCQPGQHSETRLIATQLRHATSTGKRRCIYLQTICYKRFFRFCFERKTSLQTFLCC